MRRPLLALLACAAALHADVETLLRRAETRLAHGNVDGARALFEQAAAADPACPQALERLATLDTEGGAASRLRYLRDASQVDPEAAARFLLELRERVIDLPEEAWLEAERSAMQPIEPLPRIAGPCRPWERLAPQSVFPPMPGPLRGEALGTPAHAHLKALRLVAKRLPRETPALAVAWARLAALQRLLGDDEAADAALSAARPATLDDRIEVAESALLASGDPLAWWRAKSGPSPLDTLLADERWQEVPARVDALSPDDAGAAGLALREGVRNGYRFHGVEAMLAAFARSARWSHTQERFVRAFLRGSNPSQDFPLAFLRLWQDTTADAALRAAPSGSYVLALLRDARTQREECASLRRAAFEAGCRCTGLLVDMSRDGQVVPEALAEADPVAMRLESALVGDNASLDRFLEEDEAWPEQLLAAREEGCRRRGLGMPAPKTRLNPWETPLSRLVYRFRCAQDIPPGWIARRVAAELDDPYPRAMDDVLLVERVYPSTAGEAISRGRWWGGNARVGAPRRSPAPLAPPIEDLLRLAPIGGAWHAAARKVLAGGGDAALRLAREMAARHPLDLRWVDAEHPDWGWTAPREARSRWEIEEAILPARQRNPAALLAHISNHEAKGRAAGLLERYATMVRDDPPADVARSLVFLMFAHELDAEARPVLEGLFARAKTDEDLFWISDIARECHLSDLAERIDARLLADGGGGRGFLGAYERARARGAVSRDPVRTRELALHPGPLETWRWRLWPWVAQDAVAAGRVDLLLEALDAIWREQPALLDPHRDDGSEDLKQLVKDDACLDLLRPLLKNGKAPLSAWCLADASLPWCLIHYRDWVRDLQPWAKLEDAGLPLGMLDVFPRGPVPLGEIAGQVRRLLRLDLAPATEDRSIWLASGLANRFEWDRRDEEFFACVGAWADWKGKQIVGPDVDVSLVAALGLFSAPRDLDLGTPLEPCALPTEVNEAEAVDYLPLFGPMLERLEKAAVAVEDPVARSAILISVASRSLDADLPDRAVRPLVLALRDSPVPGVREYAYLTLCDLYDRCPDSRGAFVDRLLEECADMAAPDVTTLRAWEARLAADEPGARERATQDLLATGRFAVPIARGLLSSSDPEVRGRAEEVLLRLAAP